MVSQQQPTPDTAAATDVDISKLRCRVCLPMEMVRGMRGPFGGRSEVPSSNYFVCCSRWRYAQPGFEWQKNACCESNPLHGLRSAGCNESHVVNIEALSIVLSHSLNQSACQSINCSNRS